MNLNIFAIVTFIPVLLLLAGAGLGGPWVWMAVLYITVFTFAMDRISLWPAIARSAKDGDGDGDDARENTAPGTAETRLAVVLGAAHFILLGAAIWAVAGPSGLAPLERLVAMIGFGLFFGQVSHPNAHNLIHRGDRRLRALGTTVYASLLFGHHVSAHRLVHHVHVATEDDPASAPIGMGFWTYLPKAWIGGLHEGYLAENVMQARAGRSAINQRHPYLGYGLSALGALALAGSIAGTMGVMGLLVMAGYAQLQIMLSDYVQHYGLARAQRPDGSVEPVGPAHSWNAPQWFSGAMMLNAPRHSDHHANPSRAPSALQIDPETMPVLPHPMPVMAVLALLPDRWHEIMDPLAAQWHPSNAAPDPFERLASERAAQNRKIGARRGRASSLQGELSNGTPAE